MKRFLFVLVLSALTGFAFAQSDVIHLKNGSVIKGTILEPDASGDIRIQTSDGNIFVYKMSAIESLNKGGDSSQNSYSLSKGIRVIDRHKGYYYWVDNGMQLTDDECYNIFNNELFETYQSAQKQFNAGRSLLLVGLVSAGATVVLLSSVQVDATTTDLTATSNYNLAMLLSYVADAGICMGCIFKGIGKGRLEWVKNSYNTGRYQSSKLSLSPSVMMTAQNDLGFGASLRFTF
ncbi:MAG: hypothetical protein J5705_02890 [Bacteroidaceae bacterium]|nr:hypothetical protein [Bacteroidaceae bacterium]